MVTTAQTTSSHVNQKSQHVKVSIASLIGTAVEWYDFYLYGLAAALIFPKLFFPDMTPIMGTLAAFASYGVGFLARPIGAAVFGHYGDKIGRKAVLVWSLLIMGLSTAAIGLLPTHASVGIWAAVLLTLLRLLQGFAVGGEWGSAVVMAVEHAPKNRRGLYGCFPQIGSPAGLLIATAVFMIVSKNMDATAFLDWGWRVPFLASLVMVAIGLFIRLKLTESPVFAEIQSKNEELKAPAMEVLKEHRRLLFITVGMKMVQNAVFYIYSVFMLAYITGTLKLDRSIGLNAILISSAIGFATLPLWSYLSDRIGRKKVYMFGTIACTLFVWPFFWLMQTGSMWGITLGVIIGLNVLHDAVYGPQAVYFSELFGTKVRLSGANIGYAIGAVLSGGFAPMIATALLAANDGKTWGVSIYITVLGIISIIATAMARETYKETL